MVSMSPKSRSQKLTHPGNNVFCNNQLFAIGRRARPGPTAVARLAWPSPTLPTFCDLCPDRHCANFIVSIITRWTKHLYGFDVDPYHIWVKVQLPNQPGLVG